MIIYKITNKINGKVYIGQTIHSLQHRWREHCYSSSGCLGIRSAIEKYGKENFIVEQIDVACDRDELDLKEQYWIEFYNCISPNGYNLKSGGKHTILSEESRKKLSEKLKGKNVGKKRTEEWKQHLRELNTGRKHTEESRKKMSEAQSGEKHHMFGKHHSEESRRKMSESRRGGKNHNFGKKISLESRKKMSESKKGMYALEKHPKAKAVVCVETGQIYPCIVIASNETGINKSCISGVCRGKHKIAGGFHWKYVKEVN